MLILSPSALRPLTRATYCKFFTASSDFPLSTSHRALSRNHLCGVTMITVFTIAKFSVYLSYNQQYIINLYLFCLETNSFVPKENITVLSGCIWEMWSMKNKNIPPLSLYSAGMCSFLQIELIVCGWWEMTHAVTFTWNYYKRYGMLRQLL